MMERNREAVISEDGQSIIFMYEGEEWGARPASDVDDVGEWEVFGPNGLSGKGCTIWDAVVPLQKKHLTRMGGR